jgi:hypothetical protein
VVQQKGTKVLQELCYLHPILHTVTSQTTVTFIPNFYGAKISFHHWWTCPDALQILGIPLQYTNRVLLYIRHCISTVCSNVNCKGKVRLCRKSKQKTNAPLITVCCWSLWSSFTVPNSITLSHLHNMKTKSLSCGHKRVNPFYQLWVALLQRCMWVVLLLKCSILSILILLFPGYNMLTKAAVWGDLNSLIPGQ